MTMFRIHDVQSVMMYQDNKTFAPTGSTKVQVSEKDYMGGDFAFENAFKKGGEVFRKYAENLRKQNEGETWK